MIAVVMGGNSAEREVSLESGSAVYEALITSGVSAFKFDWNGDNLDELWKKEISKVFIILHGRGGEDGQIQHELEKRNIPYTGSDSSSSRLCMDKSKSKNALRNLNILLSDSIVAKKGEFLTPNFAGPWAVKPVQEGSSIGISKVTSIDNLQDALENAWKYDDALIEKWIEGGEYTVGILNNVALPVIHIKPQENFYDYNAKYISNATEFICPADIAPELSNILQQQAIEIFNKLGCKDWGRVDFIVDQNNKPYFLEINTVPGMTSHSLVPTAAKSNGLTFENLVLEILNAS